MAWGDRLRLVGSPRPWVVERPRSGQLGGSGGGELGSGGALGAADAEFAGVDAAPGGAGDLAAFLGDIGRRLRLHRVHIMSDAPIAPFGSAVRRTCPPLVPVLSAVCRNSLAACPGASRRTPDMRHRSSRCFPRYAGHAHRSPRCFLPYAENVPSLVAARRNLPAVPPPGEFPPYAGHAPSPVPVLPAVRRNSPAAPPRAFPCAGIRWPPRPRWFPWCAGISRPSRCLDFAPCDGRCRAPDRGLVPYVGELGPSGLGWGLFGAESARLGDTAVPCRGLRW